MIRHRLPVCLLAAAGLLAGCSTTQGRIDQNQPAFARYAPAVQEKIRSGRVEPGFTPEMVRMALGEPARILQRKTAAGETEVWVYRDDRVRFSFGIGAGTANRHTAMGGGMVLGDSGYSDEDRLRVEFKAGIVSAIEQVRP